MAFKHSGQEPLPQPDFAPVEPGTYSATIIKAEETFAKSTNNPMLALQLQVWTPSGSQRMVFDNLVATEGAAWKTQQFCNALRIDYVSGEIEPQEIIGRTVTIEVVTKKNLQTGKEQNSVKAYLASQQVENIKQSAKREPGTPVQAPAGATVEEGIPDLPF